MLFDSILLVRAVSRQRVCYCGYLNLIAFKWYIALLCSKQHQKLRHSELYFEPENNISLFFEKQK